jgi:hypothetical protein
MLAAPCRSFGFVPHTESQPAKDARHQTLILLKPEKLSDATAYGSKPSAGGARALAPVGGEGRSSRVCGTGPGEGVDASP